MSDPFWKVDGEDLVLRVRATPNASRDAVEGAEADADGRPYLRVRVRAVPEKGKANKAVAALLAKAWGVPKSSVSVVKGETDRVKTLQITGGAHLASRLQLDFGDAE